MQGNRSNSLTPISTEIREFLHVDHKRQGVPRLAWFVLGRRLTSMPEEALAP